MGKGAKTSQLGVKKSNIKHAIGDGSGAPLGGGVPSGETPANICLFSLELKVKYTPSADLRFNRGDPVTLARVNSNEVGVFLNNRWFSSYEGDKKDLLLGCMAKGYVYSGNVQSVGANTLRAVVKGGGLSHEAA